MQHFQYEGWLVGQNTHRALLNVTVFMMVAIWVPTLSAQDVRIGAGVGFSGAFGVSPVNNLGPSISLDLDAGDDGSKAGIYFNLGGEMLGFGFTHQTIWLIRIGAIIPFVPPKNQIAPYIRPSLQMVMGAKRLAMANVGLGVLFPVMKKSAIYVEAAPTFWFSEAAFVWMTFRVGLRYGI